MLRVINVEGEIRAETGLALFEKLKRPEGQTWECPFVPFIFFFLNKHKKWAGNNEKVFFENEIMKR